MSIDKHTPCLNFVRDTAKQLGFKNVFTDRADVFTYLQKMNTTYDLIFADPPYELANIESIYSLIMDKKCLEPNGFLIIEHGAKTNFSDKKYYTETRKYGNVNFSFFKFTSD